MLCNIRRQDTIELYKGDTLNVEFTVNWETGSPVDLTFFKARFVVIGTSISKDSANPSEITILTPYDLGQMQVHLLPADTTALTANREYKYDAEIYDVSGNVYTFAQGIFKVI